MKRGSYLESLENIMAALIRFSVLLTVLVAFSPLARAEYLYTLNSSTNNSLNSVLDLQVSGTILGSEIGYEEGDITVAEQHAGAVTRYNGNVAANFHAGWGANSLISFSGNGSANAINPTGLFSIPLQYTPGIPGSGVGATGPANYGVQLSIPTPEFQIPEFTIPGTETTLNLGTITAFSVEMAVRELQLGVTSAAQLPIDPGTRQFDASQLSLQVGQGFADVSANIHLEQENILVAGALRLALGALASQYPQLNLQIGGGLLSPIVTVGFNTRLDMSGATLQNGADVGNGTVTWNGPDGNLNSQVTVPVNVALAPLDFGIGSLNLGLVGQLRGTATIPNVYHVPEPSSLLLAGVVGLVSLAYRRRVV